MKKLNEDFQNRWKDNNFFFPTLSQTLENNNITLHGGVYSSTMSSQTSCMNVLGRFVDNKDELIKFLENAGIMVDDILEFPTGFNYDGEIYNDKGFVIFEWMGPKKSAINEDFHISRGSTPGTCVDAFIIAKIKGKIVQILIEWKLTESYSGSSKFNGGRGFTRAQSYASILSKYRQRGNKDKFPFIIKDEDSWGLYDLGYEPLYQLLRMMLLAKETTNNQIGNYKIDDYIILHLDHSDNDKLNIVSDDILTLYPGLKYLSEKSKSKIIFDIWKFILTDMEKSKFISAFWNKNILNLPDSDWKNYCIERYC